MSTQTRSDDTYTIKQTAELTGFSESNLRFYETIGLIPPITRDVSSKYRIYSEADIDYIVSIACLSATGMSIPSMKIYLSNVARGASAAFDQIALLDKQNNRLRQEGKSLKLRQEYLYTKANYWRAVLDKNIDVAEQYRLESIVLAKQLKDRGNDMNNLLQN